MCQFGLILEGFSLDVQLKCHLVIRRTAKMKDVFAWLIEGNWSESDPVADDRYS